MEENKEVLIASDELIEDLIQDCINNKSEILYAQIKEKMLELTQELFHDPAYRYHIISSVSASMMRSSILTLFKIYKDRGENASKVSNDFIDCVKKYFDDIKKELEE